jgi:uncharacterized protein
MLMTDKHSLSIKKRHFAQLRWADLIKHLHRSALLLLTTLCVPIMGHAASFDCAKTISFVEKTVCSDAQLSKLDDALGAAFRAASANADVGTQLTRDQRRWLGIRNACRDRTCIKSAYEARIVELQARSRAKAIKGVSIPQGDFRALHFRWSPTGV